MGPMTPRSAGGGQAWTVHDAAIVFGLHGGGHAGNLCASRFAARG